jgi:replication-associated recombination protein RarA
VSAFDPVIGQPDAVAALRSHIARTGGSGATLIVGPEGVGRFLLARCAADAILGPAVRSDLLVLDPGAGIDGVRASTAQLARKPLEGPCTVLILRDADKLSVAALNALLKTLEEPPAGASIFVVAEAPEFLPETVVSRCRIVRARPLSDAQCAQVTGLDEAADAEGSPGRALYQKEHKVTDAATALVDLLGGPGGDVLGAAEKIARRRPSEDSKQHRRRMSEVLRVAGTRLRRQLPESEDLLRETVAALGSLAANANAGIVFADLALHPWKKKRPKANRRT